MALVYFLIIVTLPWVVWVPAVILEKMAKKEKGGTSIYPVIPFFPLGAWGLAALLNLAYPEVGFQLVGGLHLMLLAAMSYSLIQSYLAIRRDRSASENS